MKMNHAQYKTPKPREACPVCGRMSVLVQDHDHLNGLCRGRICQRCNHAIGVLENQDVAALTVYLGKWKTEHEFGGVPFVGHRRRLDSENRNHQGKWSERWPRTNGHRMRSAVLRDADRA